MLWEIIAFLIFFKLLVAYTNGRCKSKVCLVGKTALITGGNSGLGLETAGTLASRGCSIIIADKDDATDTVTALKKETHNPNICSLQVDYTSFESVRKFADRITSTVECLDILINNAGIGDLNYELTNDGLQKTMQVNYFSHFLLVHLLADLLIKSKTRILFSSSMVAYTSRLVPENIKGENPDDGHHSSTSTYGASKLCLAIASKIFAQKFNGTGVTSNCYHPGVVKTKIFNLAFANSRGLGSLFPMLFILWAVLFGKTIEEGSQPILHLALSEKFKNTTGKFIWEVSEFKQPKQIHDKEFCERIWRLSEQIVELKPEEKLDFVLKSNNATNKNENVQISDI